MVCFIDMSPLIFSHSFTCSSAGMFFIQCKEMEQVSPLLTRDILSSMLIFSISCGGFAGTQGGIESGTKLFGIGRGGTN